MKGGWGAGRRAANLGEPGKAGRPSAVLDETMRVKPATLQGKFGNGRDGNGTAAAAGLLTAAVGRDTITRMEEGAPPRAL